MHKVKPDDDEDGRMESSFPVSEKTENRWTTVSFEWQTPVNHVTIKQLMESCTPGYHRIKNNCADARSEMLETLGVSGC